MLSDFRTLLRESTKDLIKATILVPLLPDYLGHCDACKSGAGGGVTLRRVVFGTNCVESGMATVYPGISGIV